MRVNPGDVVALAYPEIELIIDKNMTGSVTQADFLIFSLEFPKNDTPSPKESITPKYKQFYHFKKHKRGQDITL